jgi:hypothetical protein
MTLPAMITEFGTQQANYGAAVGESLVKLGQQVGQQLAMREYQKQAATALPALQESYKNAFGKISRGEVADGYADILSASMNPAVVSNPFLQTVAKQAEELARNAGNVVVQQGFQRGSGGGGSTVPALNPEDYGYRTPPKQQPIAATRVTDTGEPLPEGGTQEEGDYVSLGEGPSEAPSNIPQYRVVAIDNAAAVANKPVEQQAEAAKSYGVTNYDKKNFELYAVSGMEKYLPGFKGFRVPTEKWVETSSRMTERGNVLPSSQLVAPHARKNFLEGPGQGQKSTLQSAKDAVSTMEDRKMSELFKQFNGDIYSLRAATSERGVAMGKTAYDVQTPEGKTVSITDRQYEAIRFLGGVVPAVAVGAGDTPAVFAEKKMTPKDAIAVAMKELGEGATDAEIMKRAKELASQ